MSPVEASSVTPPAVAWIRLLSVIDPAFSVRVPPISGVLATAATLYVFWIVTPTDVVIVWLAPELTNISGLSNVRLVAAADNDPVSVSMICRLPEKRTLAKPLSILSPAPI